MKGFKQTPENPNDEEINIAETLFNYPSLEKVFDSNRAQNFAETKEKMRSTIIELERVVRRGSKQEAEKAERIIQAYRITLDFLDELESLRTSQNK